jgi:putative transposase
MIKAFKYKLEPTKAQVAKLTWTLERCRELYNAGLENRITAYKKAGVSMNYHSQAVSLPEVKEVRPEYNDVHSQVLQDVLKRLDKAYQAFFRRVKRGAKAGFPRFQGKYRFDSFSYPQYKQVPTEKSVYLPKIGNVKIRLSRPIEGKVKTCTVKRDACGDWFVIFTCEVEAKLLRQTGQTIGIDLGLIHIITPSEGKKTEARKYFSKAEKALRKAQRRLARRKKGSVRREKARRLVAKLHRKVQRQRLDFLHKLSTDLIKVNDVIQIEDLNIKGLASGMLAKRVNDAAWGTLTQMLDYKAEYAGRQVVRVDPRYTSQDCSNCGHRSGKKPLHIRKWVCENCGSIHDRDVNAAKNIQARAELLWRNADVVESYVPQESPLL